MKLDEAALRWINHWPTEVAPVFQFLSDATKRWDGRIALLLAFAYFIWRKDTRIAVFVALMAAGLSNEVTDILKSTFPLARPCNELEGVPVPFGALSSNGTASAHSANMAAVATALALAVPRTLWLWGPIAFLTGLSRIYGGVHYPSQVVLGWAVGVAVAIVLHSIFKRLPLQVKGWSQRRSGVHTNDHGCSS